ncbi:efflux RND transporter periplasmic adaptor subunit [Ottowia massiliensis]|uniref:efflux RND transporter periplasmic adaptor subunit n=1 Tax=Ottowia massiliensis TaxID=2045302 RepID=UPI000C853236|nr:efflux RND transporter periplasmic adaptor subunit [Ottowia massiliensis]
MTSPSLPEATSASARPARWRGALGVLALLAALAALGWWLVERAQAGPQASTQGFGPGGGGRSRVTVGTALAQQGKLAVQVQALGTATPLASVTLAPQVSGVLTEVLFEEGQMVKKGDVLARIDPRPFEQALAQARAQRAQQQAQLQAAQVTLRRYETLWKQDSIARQELDTQAAQVQQLQAAAQAAAAAVETAQINLGHTRITAPITGRMGLRAVDAGNLVSSATALATLTQMHPMDVLFSVPQDHVPAVLAAQQAGQALPVTALDRARAHVLAEGRFATLDNQIDAATGSARAKARFSNEGASLFPNQFVNVRLQLGEREGVLIPVTAVRTGPEGHYVYVVDEAGVAHTRAVTPGMASAEAVQIEKGLQAGERVVTEGGDRVRDGQPVQLQGQAQPQAAPGAGGEGRGQRRGRGAQGQPPAV